MLDRAARRLVDPLLNRIADRCLAWGFSANQMSTAGFCIGMAAALAIAREQYLLGLLLLLVNRFADGVDGAIARKSTPSDFGAYLDIVFDFIIYSAVPLAMAAARPEHAAAAAFLIFSFVGTGTTFLAFAIFEMRAKPKQGLAEGKGFTYLGGLTEGTETIIFFVLVLLFPDKFQPAAFAFGALCWLTVLGRFQEARKRLR